MAYSNKSTHGGHYGKNMMDPGAVGNGYKEAVLAQEINKKFLSAIKGSKDASDFNGTNQNQNLANIVSKMNQQAGSNDYAISHHFNAFNKQATGTEVWYYTGDAKGKKLAEDLSKAISKVLGITNRGAKATTDLYVVRNSNAHTVLIEWCFIDNANDMKAWKSKGDKAINAALKVLGYEGGSNVEKAEYYDKTGWYEMLKDDTFYTSSSFTDKTRSGWKLSKGSKFYVDEVAWNPSKTARRGVVKALGGAGKRYMSLNKTIVKKV